MDISYKILGLVITILIGVRIWELGYKLIHLFPTSKRPIPVVRIEFDNVAGVFDYPKGIRVPSIDEYVWFDVWKQGHVLSITNKTDGNFFVTTIRIGENNK